MRKKNKSAVNPIKVVDRRYDEYGNRMSICEDFLGRRIVIFTNNLTGDVSITYDGLNNSAITIGQLNGVNVFIGECWKVKTGISWKLTNPEND